MEAALFPAWWQCLVPFRNARAGEKERSRLSRVYTRLGEA